VREAKEIMAALASSGLNADQLALVMELSAAVATECRPIVDSAAQRRRAKDKQYQAERRQNRQKSADAPPKEDIQTPSSDPEGSGAAAPDEMKGLFDRGVEVLMAGGRSEREARSMVGKWNKTHGSARTLEALTAAAGKPDPLAYANAFLAKPKSDLADLMASIDQRYGATAAGTG